MNYESNNKNGANLQVADKVISVFSAIIGLIISSNDYSYHVMAFCVVSFFAVLIIRNFNSAPFIKEHFKTIAITLLLIFLLSLIVTYLKSTDPRKLVESQGYGFDTAGLWKSAHDKNQKVLSILLKESITLYDDDYPIGVYVFAQKHYNEEVAQALLSSGKKTNCDPEHLLFPLYSGSSDIGYEQKFDDAYWAFLSGICKSPETKQKLSTYISSKKSKEMAEIKEEYGGLFNYESAENVLESCKSKISEVIRLHIKNIGYIGYRVLPYDNIFHNEESLASAEITDNWYRWVVINKRSSSSWRMTNADLTSLLQRVCTHDSKFRNAKSALRRFQDMKGRLSMPHIRSLEAIAARFD